MLTLLLACGPGADTATDDATWYRDVKPITDRSCTSCHTDGGIAPFPLTTYEEVSLLSEVVADAVAERRMPPWGADSTLQTYLDDRSLSDAEIEAILGWVEAGTPLGDPDDAVEVPADEVPTLERVDATIEMEQAYAPDFTASPDDYRCFVLDWPVEEEGYITGIDVHPGNESIVHHVIAFLAPPEQVGTYVALDEADPRDGLSLIHI